MLHAALIGFPSTGKSTLFQLMTSTKDAPKGKGISCFLVERDTPGLVIGKAERKMGQHGSPTNAVHFEGCRVPEDHLLGEAPTTPEL